MKKKKEITIEIFQENKNNYKMNLEKIGIEIWKKTS